MREESEICHSYTIKRAVKERKAGKGNIPMKTTMKPIAAIVALLVCTNPLTAGVIERACNKMDRKAATRSTCSCVQQVADQKLSYTDQRKAAKFFKDPHLAQETRQSDNAATERFWLRYKAFGTSAGQICS